MAQMSRPRATSRGHSPKPDTEPESPVERAFRYGNVKRDAVLMVLDSTMSDARKLAYLRAWVTDSPMVEPSRPADTGQQDWSRLPTYTCPSANRHSPVSSSAQVGVS
jgi:hypothetical protein